MSGGTNESDVITGEITSSFVRPSINVLLVDDHPLVYEVMRLQLAEETDIYLMCCPDPDAALDKACEIQATVILQDLVMPNVDGLQLIERYRANEATREIPLIVLSSREEPLLKADAFQRGANDYIVKLPDKVELVARIRYHSQSYINLIQRREAHLKLKRYSERLELEQLRSEHLLLNILPREVASRLKRGETTIADHYSEASVLFADIVGFTATSARLSATQVVEMLNKVFSRYDELTARYGLEKIKTIGDAYMVVGGVPQRRSDHAELIAKMALAILHETHLIRDTTYPNLDVRIGFHIGPVVAGIIGKQKFSYDLWGETVNLAQRLEGHGLPGRIQVTRATSDKLAEHFAFERRGEVELKGFGPTETWFLVEKR